MDLAIVSWVAEHLHTPFLDWLMPQITRLGDSGMLWLSLSFLLLLHRRTRRTGLTSLIALALVLTVGLGVLKPLIGRARPFTHLPELTLLIPPETGFSFPSGHTASSFASALSIRFASKNGGRIALVFAAAIAFSRLYLSVHYLTDILAGVLLGCLCAYAARWLTDGIYSKWH